MISLAYSLQMSLKVAMAHQDTVSNRCEVRAVSPCGLDVSRILRTLVDSGADTALEDAANIFASEVL